MDLLPGSYGETGVMDFGLKSGKGPKVRVAGRWVPTKLGFKTQYFKTKAETQSRVKV